MGAVGNYVGNRCEVKFFFAASVSAQQPIVTHAVTLAPHSANNSCHY